MRTERDTRQASHRARRAHTRYQAEQHGWSHTAIPLAATLGERLAAQADELLTDTAASLRDAWQATNEAREVLVVPSLTENTWPLKTERPSRMQFRYGGQGLSSFGRAAKRFRRLQTSSA
ncbi:MAG TPA: hypothetical protein VFR23_24810 [Jiangellaceae bacterium]|nr:hypothetical protein [Jiangellaceae bacterium]